MPPRPKGAAARRRHPPSTSKSRPSKAAAAKARASNARASARRTLANPARRLAVCSLLVVIVFGALAVRVTQLQVLSGNRYRQMSLHQTQKTVPLPAQRGTIFDRNGSDLAMSIELTSIYADPKQVTDGITYAAELAPILHVTRKDLLARLENKHFDFEYLARRVSDGVVNAVKKLELPGIGYLPESARRYPADPLAGSLIGHVGGQGSGREGGNGLEYLYDNLLAGKDGKLIVERDQQGLDIPNTATQQIEARRGSDLVLTLDESLQWQAEQALVDQVTATNAKGGMAAVVDVTTGDVLALASVDGASASGPARPSAAGEINQPLMQLFEPGSTNKLITLSTAIESGVVGPDTMIDVPSQLQIGNAVFKDVDVHGNVQMSVSDILRQSSNIGTIEIAQHMPKERLAEALRSFGLGARTAVDFPGQASGLLLDPSKYYDTGLASTAIGYGAAVTGMQMLDAYATIANGGVTRPPRLLDATIDSQGKRHPALQQRGRRVVSPKTALEMTNMLTGVVSDGTGACAAIPGYIVAGKTGTSRKAVNGGYSAGTMASFIGFAPAQSPRLAAIVVLDEPSSEFGGAAAAPVFSSVMQFALTRSGVAPDDVGNTQFNASRAAAAQTGANCDPPPTALATLHRTAATTPTTAPATTSTTAPAPTSTTSTTASTTGPTATSTTGVTATTRSKATPSSLGHDTSPSG
jgi:cell division protein FtsI (penicillin-binding protein 3)